MIGLTGGGFVIAWQSVTGGNTDIEFQLYNNAGVAQGGVVTVADGGASDNNNEVELIALQDGVLIEPIARMTPKVVIMGGRSDDGD